MIVSHISFFYITRGNWLTCDCSDSIASLPNNVFGSDMPTVLFDTAKSSIYKVFLLTNGSRQLKKYGPIHLPPGGDKMSTATYRTYAPLNMWAKHGNKRPERPRVYYVFTYWESDGEMITNDALNMFITTTLYYRTYAPDE